MVLRRGQFTKVDKVAAWSLSALCVIGGSAGIVLAGAHMHWRLGLASAGAVVLGILFAVAASRGRPI